MSKEDLIRYVGDETVYVDYHDGQLRPSIGVQNYQILRANRSNPSEADDFGWTQNHAPMLAHWKGTFYLEYLSTPVSEHVPPGQNLLMTSLDGSNWSKPFVVFPKYKIPNGVYQNPSSFELPEDSFALTHQRMGFYESPNGRFLVCGFYGICPHYTVFPNDGNGIGRVVREIFENGELGPIYFIRYNRHAGWNESNTGFPFYKTSEDAEFISACESLLADKLVTMQWWEEDRSEDGFYTISGERAPSTYILPDGRVVALYKFSKAAISNDIGQSWSEIKSIPSVVMSGGKVWGQQTPDGKYALIYNPTPNGNKRWPLAIVTSQDGVEFNNMLVVNGDVSPRRYNGLLRGYGLGYIRGIEAGNKNPTGSDMWLTYSMNKEDIWISRVPVPVRYKVDNPVEDTFNEVEDPRYIENWNIRSCKWASVTVENYPSEQNKSLCLRDKDPYEFAKAVRVFPESKKVTLDFKLSPRQSAFGKLYVDICDKKGSYPVRILFEDGMIKVLDQRGYTNLQNYHPNAWYEFKIFMDVGNQKFAIQIGDASLSSHFIAPVTSIERIEFRTGEKHLIPTLETSTNAEDLPGGEFPDEEAIFYLNYLKTSDHS